jgi:hypothetical protein
MKKINIDGLLALNPEEIEIVYRRLRGESVRKIAVDMEIPESTVWNQRNPQILKLLGVNEWREVEEELKIPIRSIIPNLQALKEGWPEEFREKIESLRESLPTQTTSDAQILSATVDQPANHPSYKTQTDQTLEREVVKPTRPRFPAWPVLAIPLFLLCLLCVAGAVFVRPLIFRPISTDTPEPQVSRAPQIADTPTATFESSPTVQFTDTDLPLPTDILTPTLTQTPTVTVTPMPTETQSTQGLGIGNELSNDRVTLRLREIKYNQGNTRVGQPVRIPIVFDFDFTNHSGQTLLLQVDQSDFRIKDDLGNEATCEYWQVAGTGPTLTQNVNDGQTIPLGVFCGRGDLPSQVKTYTLYVTGFSSLSDSTWVHKVVR